MKHNTIDEFISRFIFILTISTCSFLSYGQEYDKYNVVKKGQQVPSFIVNNENGEQYNIEDCKGSIVLINFFATWCGPCVAEMPLLQNKVWLKYKDHKNFKLIALGRGHNQNEVIDFKNKNNLGFPIYGDKDKAVYNKFATRYIPRNYIINTEGKIVYTSIGFSEEEFNNMINILNDLIESNSKQ